MKKSLIALAGISFCGAAHGEVPDLLARCNFNCWILMKRSPIAIAFAAFALFTACIAPVRADDAALPVKPGKNFTYKEAEGKPEHMEMEIFFPPDHDPARNKVPGVILFHGGSWHGGHLEQFRAACQYFASRGLVAATANYRMWRPEEDATLPDGESFKRICITDAKSAIRWFKHHADEFGIDPQRIITGGGSAGGHIAILATTNSGLNDPRDPQDIDTSVVAYLLFNPALHPTEDLKDAEVDAIKHVGSGFAPAFVVFGTEDTWKIGWGLFQKHLRALGNTTTELWLAEGQKHAFFRQKPWDIVTLAEADRFLAQHGLLAGDPALPPPATGEKLVRTTKSESM
jgi:acetyl esterase/lipase